MIYAEGDLRFYIIPFPWLYTHPGREDDPIHVKDHRAAIKRTTYRMPLIVRIQKPSVAKPNMAATDLRIVPPIQLPVFAENPGDNPEHKVQTEKDDGHRKRVQTLPPYRVITLYPNGGQRPTPHSPAQRQSPRWGYHRVWQISLYDLPQGQRQTDIPL